MRGVIPEEDHQGSVQLPRWRQVEERALHAKKKCTQSTMRLGEGTQGQVEGFICTPQALGSLWNFFCSRDLTRSIFHGKPHPQLTCGEMLGKEFNTHLVFLGLPLESPPRRSPSGSLAAAQVRGNLEETPT